MPEPSVRFVVFRYRHHSAHSGYSRVADYGAEVFHAQPIRVEKPLSRRIIRERILWKLAKGTPGYDRAAMAAEVKVGFHILRESGFIYHFLYGETTYHYAGYLNNIRGNRLVATFHLPPSGIAAAVQTNLHIQRLSAVVCVGRNQMEYFAARIKPDKIFYAPLGVATDYFCPPATVEARDPDLCLIVGENYRDFPTLRGVIELVAYLRPKTRFVAVIPPKSASLLGEHPNLTYRAGISEDELRALYRSAQVSLMPLLDATANNAILESMSCGLPLVVTDVGAIRDYVHPDCAILVRPSRSREMAEATIDLLGNESARLKMSARCREHALNFSWQKAVEQLRSVYTAIA